MARSVRDATLESRSARSRLTVRGAPYYRAIDTGLHLGYRRGRRGGVWLARFYVGTRAGYEFESIGPADDKLDADGETIFSFQHAQAKARDIFTRQRRTAAGLSAKIGPFTVSDCCDLYVAKLEAEGRSAADARSRFLVRVRPQLGTTRCDRLTAPALQKWLADLAAAPAQLRSKRGVEPRVRELKAGDPDAVRRRRATANRIWTTLRAALNHAFREGRIASDAEWRRVKPFRVTGGARVRFLTVEECRRLINAADPDFRSLVRAALATGCRYGELTRLIVADFNPDGGTLHVRTSKSGKGRHVVLNDEGVKFFAALTAGRTGTELMLGREWHRAQQGLPMKEACERAKIVPPIGFHGLRHTWASLSVMAGMPLMIVARNMGHSDTRMVEAHYGHMSKDFFSDAVRAAAPSFGVDEPTTVKRLTRKRS